MESKLSISDLIIRFGIIAIMFLIGALLCTLEQASY